MGYDALENTYSDADAELRAQGLSNVILGVIGGMISAGSIARTRVAYDAGARGRESVVVHAGLLGLSLFDALALLPGPVVAAIMLLIAWGMVDRWATSRVATSLKARVGSARRDASLVVATATAAVIINPLFAVLLGFILSLFFVLGDMSRPVDPDPQQRPGAALAAHASPMARWRASPRRDARSGSGSSTG